MSVSSYASIPKLERTELIGSLSYTLQLTDSMASLALTTSGLPPPTGVSVNISTEFLRPGGTEGDEIVLESEVLKLGPSSSHLMPANDSERSC